MCHFLYLWCLKVLLTQTFFRRFGSTNSTYSTKAKPFPTLLFYSKPFQREAANLPALLLQHSGIFKSRKKMQQSLSYSFDIGTEVCITINLCLSISMRCDKKSWGYLLKNSCMLIYTRVPSEYVYHIISYLGKLLPSLLGSSANLQHGPLAQTEEYWRYLYLQYNI